MVWPGRHRDFGSIRLEHGLIRKPHVIVSACSSSAGVLWRATYNQVVSFFILTNESWVPESITTWKMVSKSQGTSTVRAAGDATALTVGFPSALGFVITSRPYKYHNHPACSPTLWYLFPSMMRVIAIYASVYSNWAKVRVPTQRTHVYTAGHRPASWLAWVTLGGEDSDWTQQ